MSIHPPKIVSYSLVMEILLLARRLCGPSFLLATCLLSSGPARAQPPLTVVYTGRTLGYFRYPEQQPRLNFDHCMDDPATMSEATRNFTEALRAQSRDAQLLVGMGDNFAMDLESRTFIDKTESGIDRQPKDMWTWDFFTLPHRWLPDNQVVSGPLSDSIAAGYGTIPADNVGCFIRFAKYDAIVPGNADFYFGPERLRMLARFLMSDGQGAAFPKVAMLAANLAVISTAPRANPRIPDYQRERGILGNEPLNYHVVQKQNGGEPTIQADLPGAVLPYLRKITIHNAFEVVDPSTGLRVVLQNEPDGATFDVRPKNPRLQDPSTRGNVVLRYAGTQPSRTLGLKYRFDTVEFCPALASVRDPYRLDLKSCIELNIDQEATHNAEQAGASTLNNDLYYTTASQVLQPNTNWGVCMRWKKPPPDNPLPICQLFSVHAPFLQYPADTLTSIPPYVIKDSGGSKIAVFGVVDPSVGLSIGRLNYAWLNKNLKYDSQIEVLDPAMALNQLMQECNAHEDCKNARKVLLAHMPNAAAANLIANIGFLFDLVVSETDDAHETGDLEASKQISGKPERGTDGRPPALVTPGSVYNARVPGKITLVVQRATVRRPEGCMQNLCSGKWALTNQALASSYTFNRATGGAMTLREAARAALLKEGVKPPSKDSDAGSTEFWTTQQILERLALLRMQDALHTDLALMQGRDIFEAKRNGELRITPDNLKEAIDRVYWKNDYALPIPVTGGMLTSLLKKGAAIAAAENNSVNIDLEKGRALVPLGVFQELATQGTIVNSQTVQDSALYSVAVTDYLAFGDTGYSEFLTPAVPPFSRMRDFRTLYPIANIVCRAIQKALISTDPAFTKTDCGPEQLHSGDYEDLSSQLPFDTTSGYSAWRQFVAWAVPSLQYHRSYPLYSGANQAERTSQQKPRFSFTVEKTDFSILLNQHQRTLVSVNSPPGATINLQATKFAGNPISQVTAPDSFAINYDNRTRFRWSGRRFNYFAMDDLAFSGSKTQDTPTNPNYIRSLSANTLGLEGGMLVRLFPKLKQAADLKLLVSERLDTELISPLLSLPLKDAQSSTYLRNLNRTYRALTKIGFRLEDNRSWLEAGLEGGQNFGLPSQYKFGNQVCPAGAGEDYHNALYANPPPPSTGPAYYPGDQSLLDCVSYYSFPASPSATASPLGPPYLNPLTNPTIFAYSPLTIYKTNRRELGMFVNFSINVPLPFSTKLSYLLENKGDLFANGHNDIATDVHYFDQLSNSLLIAARGNLSIKPEVDIFAYSGKVNGFKMITYQAMLNLSYAFDWHSGLPLLRTMVYANPGPKTSAPPGGR
jgi:hypothetical protein